VAALELGVPLITQVELFRLNPLGSAGVPALIAQLCTVAPEPALIVVGVMLIATPTVPDVPVALTKERAEVDLFWAARRARFCEGRSPTIVGEQEVRKNKNSTPKTLH
jgi:hypothetical protein